MSAPWIDPKDLVRILALVSEQPNQRSKPLPGDLEGDYDQWFDGGAVTMQTGLTIFKLMDGTKVTTGTFPWLNFTAEFPNGSKVTIEQEHQE